MQNIPGSQSSNNPEAQDQHSEFDHIWSGYAVQSLEGIDIVMLNAIQMLAMDLAVLLKPDISEVLKMLEGCVFITLIPTQPNQCHAAGCHTEAS
jgi:hypothetical protein